MSVNHQNMEILQESDSFIFHKFKADRNFVVSRTKNAFSSMRLFQCNEQLNKDVKGKSGMVGLTEDEDKLRQWTICSPEISRAVAKFEKGTLLEARHHAIFLHHEDSDSSKARFSKHVSNLTTELKQLGGPFLPDEGAKLIQQGTRDVTSQEVINTVRII